MERKDLTPKQQDKLDACTTAEDVLAFAKEEGLELSDRQLSKIAGGWNSTTCPKCGCKEHGSDHTGTVNMVYVCKRCGHRW